MEELSGRRRVRSPPTWTRYLALFLFAVSFYPRMFAHVAKAVTGLDPREPEFEKRWSDFLRELARKCGK